VDGQVMLDAGDLNQGQSFGFKEFSSLSSCRCYHVIDVKSIHDNHDNPKTMTTVITSKFLSQSLNHSVPQ